MRRGIRRRDERAASAVEYALLVAAIAMLALMAVGLKDAMSGVFASQGCDESAGYYCDT